MNSNEQLWRCTVCGQIGTVGRCCGRDTREPVGGTAGANEPKHTPGPWHILMRDNYMRLFMPKNVVGLTGDVARGYVGHANARLIAAAPELLEACAGAVERHRPYMDESGFVRITLHDYAAILSAIAKATGKEADTCNRCGEAHEPGTAGHIRDGLRHGTPREVIDAMKVVEEMHDDGMEAGE